MDRQPGRPEGGSMSDDELRRVLLESMRNMNNNLRNNDGGGDGGEGGMHL